MKVLITGATGLVGQELVRLLHNLGYTIHYLSTRKDALKSEDNYKGFYWNIKEQYIDINCFDGVEKIIHLAGARVAERWTVSYKQEILNSRIASGDLLLNSLKTIDHKVKHFVSASGISIYKDSLTAEYTEQNQDFDTTFLADVVKAWESKADEFKELNINVSKIRIGVVLASNNSALQKMVKPIRLRVGSIFGSGKQWMSWIHLHDLAALFVHVITNNLEGVYNATAPNPTTNRIITKTIAKQLKRKIILPDTPKFVMRLILGEMHTLLFDSQNVLSKKIEQTGFEFKYPQLELALDDLLN